MIVNDLIYFFIFIFGVCIGSFLNAVIYRIEQKKGLNGRSLCPHCKHKLSWQDLLPIFSFLLLRGECRYCKKTISWQYPIVELTTGLIFVLVFATLSWNFFNLVFLFYISAVLIVLFVYDLKHYIIPDKILLPAIFIALGFDLIFNFSLFFNFLLAVAVASGFFLVIFLVSKGKWMGFGDVKLAVLMGLLLGFSNVLAALFLAFFFGAIIGIILMVFPFGSAQGKQRKSLKSEIPFGPFLIIGTFLAMFWGQAIIQWYLNFFQI